MGSNRTSHQLGPIEMPALKKAHWDLKNLGLTNSKGKLLAAFGSRTGGVQPVLVGLPGHFPFDHDPRATLGAGNARADDPISHFPFSVNDFSSARIRMTKINQPSSVLTAF